MEAEEEEQAAKMAQKFSKNATEDDVKNVEQNMNKMNRGPLAKIWNKVVQLWNAFKSPDTPLWMKSVIIGSLIYMISPIDFIPDAIPVLGLTDDVSVIGLAFSQLIKLGSIITVTAGVIKITDLTQRAIWKEIKKRPEKIASCLITKCIDKGDVKIVNIHLHDENDNEIGEETIEAEKCDKSIKQGVKSYDYLSIKMLRNVGNKINAYGLIIKKLLKENDFYKINVNFLDQDNNIIENKILLANEIEDNIDENLEMAV